MKHENFQVINSYLISESVQFVEQFINGFIQQTVTELESKWEVADITFKQLELSIMTYENLVEYEFSVIEAMVIHLTIN